MNASAPHLRTDLRIIEQVYRDEQSFVVKDPVSHGYFRFRPMEVRVMRLFDGMRSATDIAEALVAEGVRLSAATVEGFARKLGALGLLERTLLERSTQQLERLRSERQRQRSLFRGELFRMRWSFGNANPLVTRLYAKTRWCFTPAFVAISVGFFAAYFVIIGTYGRAFAADLAASYSPAALTPTSMLVLVIAFSALTLAHEMGHALACKHFGGDVHEMGFMLLYFLPAFYANVNDAWSFQERRARLWVTAAGGWIELFLTALMSLVWLVARPGSLLAQFAVASMLIGGVANILINVNPLIPLDGYFALGDWLEIPNLRLRAQGYLADWSRRYVLGMEVAEKPLAVRERRILLTYGAAAAAYRVALLLFILSHVVAWVDRSLGAFAAGAIVCMVLYRLRNPLTTMLTSVRLAIRSRRVATKWRRRRRVALVAVFVAVGVSAVLPWGLTTSGTFVVLPSSRVTVTAPASGVVVAVNVREGDLVAAGAPLVQLADFASSHVAAERTRIADSLTMGAQWVRATSRAAEAGIITADAEAALASSAVMYNRTKEFRVRSNIGGTVLTSRPEALIGRRVQFGDTLVTIGDATQLEAVLLLRTTGAERVRANQRVRLMSYIDVSHPIEGVIGSVAPAAGAAGVLDARVDLGAGTPWRMGATGEGRVVVARSTLLMAILRAVRARIRTDALM